MPLSSFLMAEGSARFWAFALSQSVAVGSGMDALPGGLGGGGCPFPILCPLPVGSKGAKSGGESGAGSGPALLRLIFSRADGLPLLQGQNKRGRCDC